MVELEKEEESVDWLVESRPQSMQCQVRFVKGSCRKQQSVTKLADHNSVS